MNELPKRSRRVENTTVVGKLVPGSEVSSKLPAEINMAFAHVEAAEGGKRLLDDVAAELCKAVSAELDLDLDATLAQIKEEAARVDQSPKTIEAAEAACDATAFDQLFGAAKTPVRKAFLLGVKSLEHRALGGDLADVQHGELTTPSEGRADRVLQIHWWPGQVEPSENTIAKAADLLGDGGHDIIPLAPQRVEITDVTPRIRRQGPNGPYKTIGGK